MNNVIDFNIAALRILARSMDEDVAVAQKGVDAVDAAAYEGWENDFPELFETYTLYRANLMRVVELRDATVADIDACLERRRQALAGEVDDE